MPLRLLPHLEAIRATPRDQRSFVAFEKRPDMIAAGAGKGMIDAFDFEDEPALDGVIGDLRLAADRQAGAWQQPLNAPLDQPRVEPMRVDANPHGFQFSEDMIAGAESRLDNVAPKFLDENVDHYSVLGGDEVRSEPQQALIDAIYKLSSTALGRQILAYGRANGLRQKFVYEQGADPEEIDVVTEEWRYDPDGVRALKGADRLTQDGFDTADFNVITGHGFGHTSIGRGALGLPALRSREPASGPAEEILIGVRSPQRVADESRAVELFENPLRRSWGLPPRTSYFKDGDAGKDVGIVR